MASENSQLIADIDALSQRLRADTAGLNELHATLQNEANRFQEMANVVNDLNSHQNDASQRLRELANGADPFRLPAVFNRERQEHPHYQ